MTTDFIVYSTKSLYPGAQLNRPTSQEEVKSLRLLAETVLAVLDDIDDDRSREKLQEALAAVDRHKP